MRVKKHKRKGEPHPPGHGIGRPHHFMDDPRLPPELVTIQPASTARRPKGPQATTAKRNGLEKSRSRRFHPRMAPATPTAARAMPQATITWNARWTGTGLGRSPLGKADNPTTSASGSLKARGSIPAGSRWRTGGFLRRVRQPSDPQRCAAVASGTALPARQVLRAGSGHEAGAHVTA